MSEKPFNAPQVVISMDVARAYAAGRPSATEHKPSNWWAHSREPWKRPCEDLAATMAETRRMIAALTPRRQ